MTAWQSREQTAADEMDEAVDEQERLNAQDDEEKEVLLQEIKQLKNATKRVGGAPARGGKRQKT